MADKMFEFRSLLTDLVEQAQIAGNVVEESFVREFFSELELGEEEFNHIYAYLKASHIEIKGYQASVSVEEEVEDYKRAAKERLEAACEESEEDTREEGDEKPKSAFLKMYFEDLEAIEEMEEAEEIRLLHFVLDGEERAEMEYIERKLHDVIKKARDFKLSEEYFEELIEEGNIGLLLGIKALKEEKDRENPKEFVDARIMSAMQDFLDESLHTENVANSMVAKVSFVSDAAKKLREENGESPSLMELAAYTNLTEEELKDIMDLSADNLKEK